MYIKDSVAKIVWQDKNYVWSRISNTTLQQVVRRIRKKPTFYYMKIYHYDRKTKTVGRQIAWVNQTSFQAL